MRATVSALMTGLFVCGCGAGQQPSGTMPVDQSTRQRAIDEVTQLASQLCEQGVHGDLSHVATEGPLLIVGTAGEVIEGRPSLEEINQSYRTRDVVVRHECDAVERMAYASTSADIVWVSEALRTHASWPNFSVGFPSQRAMIFERMPEGWRLRYYALSVRLPDDQLDEAYAEPVEGASDPSAATAAPAAGE